MVDIKIGALVVGVTAVLVVAILIVYIIKANLKRARMISARPVTKIHYSKGQPCGHVSIIHVSNGDEGHPTQCDQAHYVDAVDIGDLVRRASTG